MKRAKLSARIVCLGLVLCCLSACTLFRGNGGVAADQAPPTAAPAGAPTAAPPMSAGSEAVGPEQPPSPAAREPETVQELPEIEIPMETAAPEGGAPHASAQPAGETASPAPPSPTPVISAAPASSEPEPDNGSTGDIQTYDNGDVMLPEAP